MKRNQLRIIAAIITGLLIVSVMASCKSEELKSFADDNISAGYEDTNASQGFDKEIEDPTVDDVTAQDVDACVDTDETDNEASVDTDDAWEAPSLPIDSTSDFTPEEEPTLSPAEIVSIASKQLGVPFKLGGSDPETGFDTSGFTYYCVNYAAKISGLEKSFPRSLKDQLECGSLIEYRDLRSGDIVYFSSEPGKEASFCGVYVGGGLMIYSPVPDDFVKTANITTNYWTTHFVTGLRPLN